MNTLERDPYFMKWSETTHKWKFLAAMLVINGAVFFSGSHFAVKSGEIAPMKIGYIGLAILFACWLFLVLINLLSISYNKEGFGRLVMFCLTVTLSSWFGFIVAWRGTVLLRS